MRQNRWDEAYQYDRNALKMMGNGSSSNDKKLSKAICCYHLALIEFRRKDLQQTLHYLQQFFDLMFDICVTIIDKEKYDHLKSKAIFSYSNDAEKIKRYFKNAAEIFIAIYGNSHPFITDFVLPCGMQD
jgi:hypothetical protein